MNIIRKLWLSILLLLLPIATLADDSPYYGIGDQLIYDGELGSVPVLVENASDGSNRCLFYLQTAPGEGLNGSQALRLTPTKWHGPAYRLYCGGGSRRDFSAHDVLEFYFRCPSGYIEPPAFHLSTWNRSSNTVNLLNHIDGGVIDNTWRKVQIPLATLATPDWTLGNVETLAWAMDEQNRTCYVDNIALRDTTPPTLITAGKQAPATESSTVLRLTFSEAYDAASIRALSNYSLHSVDDSDYSTATSPVDTGMHYRIQRFDNSGIPQNRYDLFLKFAKPLKNGQQYTLNLQGVKDRSGNAITPIPYRFTYADQQQLNQNIKVNQVGYLPERPKVGYVGGYFGDLGGGVWAVGDNGKILFHDQQSGWQEQTTPVTTPLRAIAATREDSAWAVGDGGVILHWNGTQWQQVVSPVSTDLLAIAFDPLNQGWIVGANGSILRYKGSVWETVTSPTSSTLRGVWAETDKSAWAVGDNGTIIRWDGIKWAAETSGTTVNLHAIGGSKADDLWAVGANGTILFHQYNRWKEWTDKPVGTADLHALAWNHSGSIWVAGDNGTLWYKTGFGSNPFTAVNAFTNASTSNDLRALARQNSRQSWGSTSNGALITKTGNDWQAGDNLNATIHGMFALPYGALRLPTPLPTVAIQNAQNAQTLLEIPLTLRHANWHLSGEDVYQFDFSALTTAGEYRAYVPGLGISDTFKIGKDVLNHAAYTTARGLFYQRSGTALTEPYAEARFTRPLSHEYEENGRKIDGVYNATLTNSPLYNNEPIGGLKDVHGGWHDAGDYGKYMPTAATALWYLLTAYDIQPEHFRDNAWNIPESRNGVPDLLDEARWELDWIVRLQASDGGVYHKVTSECWFGDMPHKETAPRHIYAKTTHDTALAAALFASAARVWQPYDSALAATYLQRARLAWSFLQAHPNNTPQGGFKNVANNCSGEYNDADDSDNRLWAAAELYRTTGESAFRQHFENWWANNSHTWGWHEWQHFYKRAYWAYLRTPAANTNAAIQQEIRNKIILDANNNRAQTLASPYQNGARLDVPDWLGWGTFTQSTMYAFPLLQAWALTGDEKYRDTAALNLDAQLGANPLAFSFITGIGKRYPQNPLHTVSIHDGVDEPVPGIPIFGIFAHMSNGKTPQRKAQEDANNYPTMFNTDDPYPILRRYTDESDLVEMSEFTIQEMAIAVGVFGLMAEPLGSNAVVDTDGDGIPDSQDTDDDNDGMPDSWELQYGLNPLDAADAAADKDDDGYSNQQEFMASSNPNDPASKPAPLRLGSNLGGISDWSTQRPFTNLFKQSRPWLTQCDNSRDSDCNGRWETNENAKLDLDADGWVKSLPAPAEPGYSIAGTVLDVPKNFPSGRYLLLYEGDGTLQYKLGAQKLSAESTAGRDVLDIDINRGLIHIQIIATDPNKSGNYLRNLRLIREADESTYQSNTFNPEFLARLQPFQALRFMDWQNTNGNEQEHWADRRPASAATYATYGKVIGAPVEVMVQLANATRKPAWFNMPHKADDDYLRQFAALVRDTLDPTLPVYVEYSNEVWNTQFSQHAWIREQANTLWPGGTDSDYTKVINWYGKRSAEMCDIWKKAFGARSSRVTCVLGAQAANTWTASAALDCSLWEHKPCSAHGIDAITIAPYFGHYIGSLTNQAQVTAWTREADGGLDKLFAELKSGGVLSGGSAGGALAEAMRWIDNYRTLTNNRGLQLLAYEGGQHLVGVGGVENDSAITNLLIKANRDPRMGALYLDYLKGWEARGGGLMMNFSDIGIPSKWGSWGVLEHVLQTTSPKYDALLDYLNGTDYEAVATLALSATSLSEKDGSLTLSVQLDKALPTPVTFTLNFAGTATRGSDYLPAATTLTIPVNATSATLRLDSLDDPLIEAGETITVTIGEVNGNARTIASTLQINLLQEDSDNDTMPDDWERHYGLNPDNASDATTDKDGDGISNKDEYLADTNPSVRDGVSPVLGTNLSGLADWSSQMPFLDLFKMSRTWITQCEYWVANPDPGCTGQWDTGEQVQLDLDANSWVKSLPKREDAPIFTRVATYWAMYPEFQGGRYVVLYEGEGTLNYGFSAHKLAAESRAGRDVINIVPDANNGTAILMTLTATDPNHTGNYLRNIRIIPEAYEATYTQHVFTPDFLERTRPFQVLRFMDWMSTNGSSQEHWSDRPLPTDARYAHYGKQTGIPLEIMLQLANELDKTPWFTLPHKADDDYMRQFATKVRDSLTPHHQVYVEYSNEVWNGIFAQSTYALQQGRALWPDAVADDHTVRMNWYGKRSAEMCHIWKEVFGNDANRVVCVMGGQAAWTYPAEQALACPLWQQGPCINYGIDALAIAPYFGGYLGDHAVSSQLEGWLAGPDGGLGKLFDELQHGGILSNSPAGGALQEASGWIGNNQQLAQQHGLQLVSYEGGQHIADIWGTLSTGVINLFTTANRDSRMGEVYTQYLNTWKQLGGGLFMHFTDIATPGRYGAWGALEQVGQTTSAKYDALLNYLNDNGGNNNTDRDGDGVPNDQDAFPDDPHEWLDSDQDSIGNNADTDDDNDGMPDTWEALYNLNPLDASDSNKDKDGDGASNLDEYKRGTDPTVADSNTFINQTGVQPATLIESNSIRLSGLTASTSMTVTGGEYRINGGTYTKAKGTLKNGDILQVRHVSSSKSTTTVTTTLKVGKQSHAFKSTTFAIDSTPAPISFTTQTGVALGSLLESNTITLSSINVPVAVSVTGGEYRINGGTYTKAKGTAKAGDTLQLRQTTSSKSNATVKTTLTVGSEKPVFSTTTLVIDSTPDAFSFTALTGVALNSWVESENITLSGINVSVAISISGGEYRINGGTYTKAKGTAKAGDTLQVRHLSSKSAKKTVTTTVTVGTAKVAFKSTTQ